MPLENPINTNFQIPKDPWEILGLNRDANVEEINKAWRAKVKEYHTDKNKNPDANEWIRAINAAREELLSPNRPIQERPEGNNPFKDFASKEEKYWKDFNADKK